MEMVTKEQFEAMRDDLLLKISELQNKQHAEPGEIAELKTELAIVKGQLEEIRAKEAAEIASREAEAAAAAEAEAAAAAEAEAAAIAAELAAAEASAAAGAAEIEETEENEGTIIIEAPPSTETTEEAIEENQRRGKGFFSW